MKTRIIAVVAAFVLALTVGLALVGCNGGGASDIVSVNKSNSQVSNGVTITNYIVVVKSSVDWANMTDANRKKITDSGVEQARTTAKNDGNNNINIIGRNEDSAMLFMYNQQDNTVIIYDGSADNNPISSVDAPAQN